MARYSYQWTPDNTSKKVLIDIYENGTLVSQKVYPQDNGLLVADIDAYCAALVAQLEVDYANAQIVAAQTSTAQSDFDDEYATLDAGKPGSPVDSDTGDTEAAILANAKEKVLAAAQANNVNPYTLIATYQSLYDAANIDVDLSTIIFEGYGGVFRKALWVDTDGDGVHDGGETGTLNANVHVTLQKVGGTNSNYTPNSRGVVLVGGLEDGEEYIFSVHAQTGALVTGSDVVIGKFTAANDTLNDLGENGIYVHGVASSSCGGVSGAFFTDTDNDGVQDGGEAAGFALDAYRVLLTKSGQNIALIPDNVGAWATAIDALPSGTWVLTVILPTGYTATGVSLPANEVVTDENMTAAGSIGIY